MPEAKNRADRMKIWLEKGLIRTKRDEGIRKGSLNHSQSWPISCEQVFSSEKFVDGVVQFPKLASLCGRLPSPCFMSAQGHLIT